MSSELDKEFIRTMPPIYHFKRAAIFKAAARAFESIGMYYEAQKCEVDGVYELALGFEALVYESLPKAKFIGSTNNGEQLIP